MEPSNAQKLRAVIKSAMAQADDLPDVKIAEIHFDHWGTMQDAAAPGVDKQADTQYLVHCAAPIATVGAR